jgi:hypothetical protein
MRFLAKYSWIFNFRVTHILSPAILERIPGPWLQFLLTLDIGTTFSSFCVEIRSQKLHVFLLAF